MKPPRVLGPPPTVGLLACTAGTAGRFRTSLLPVRVAPTPVGAMIGVPAMSALEATMNEHLETPSPTRKTPR
jgi:hypothetical protein